MAQPCIIRWCPRPVASLSALDTPRVRNRTSRMNSALHGYMFFGAYDDAFEALYTYIYIYIYNVTLCIYKYHIYIYVVYIFLYTYMHAASSHVGEHLVSSNILFQASQQCAYQCVFVHACVSCPFGYI